MRIKFIKLIMILVIVIFASTFYIYYKLGYFRSEWHNRHVCKQHIATLAHALEIYAGMHDGRLPCNLYILYSEGYRDRIKLICPSKYNSVPKAYYREKDYPLQISSYLLMSVFSRIKLNFIHALLQKAVFYIVGGNKASISLIQIVFCRI